VALAPTHFSGLRQAVPAPQPDGARKCRLQETTLIKTEVTLHERNSIAFYLRLRNRGDTYETDGFVTGF
jgi:hypothetical protein